jgi:hypothetical protein
MPPMQTLNPVLQGSPITVANRIMGYRVFESKNRYAIIKGATDTLCRIVYETPISKAQYKW